MKNIIQSIWISGILLITTLPMNVAAQDPVIDVGDKADVTCVTEAQYQQFIRPLLKRNIDMLDSIKMARGEKPQPKMLGGIYFSWPLRMDENYSNINGVYSYFYISNFADLDHTEDLDEDEEERLDWMCFTGPDAKNYDQHNGADIVPYPYPWQLMDDEAVDVIAAADGEVIYIEDGYFDRNCEKPHILGAGADFNGGYYGNFVALRHDDMSITVYAHLKEGTVASLSVGDYIRTGTYLGKVGSSGNSSAPHLHFEYRPTEFSQYDEPWWAADGCNDDLTESKWISQIPYYNPQLVRITTHDALPVGKDCADYEAGSNEDEFISNHFSTGATLRIGVALRDYLVGDEMTIQIYNASDVLQETITHTSAANYERATFYFTESLFLYASGTYKIRVFHNSKYYYHYFTVSCPVAASYTGAQSGVKGYLNGDNINSTATISGFTSNNILYEAENYIKLNPGFQATQNCAFRAKIDPCTIGDFKLEDEHLLSETDMIVFPNPNMGVFTVAIPETLMPESVIEIYDGTGRLAYTAPLDAEADVLSFDLSQYPKGIYLIALSNLTQRFTEQVVVQ